MSLEAKYTPSNIESKWYQYWLDNQYFHSTPDDRESYTVVIPPPNVTGVLHMGHMLNNTIQDVLVRRARMLGKNACWVPGTDHASIATEAKVVNSLREKGIKKGELTRDEFMKHAWEWKEEYGGIILKQLKKLGVSCDWERTSFTLNPAYSESVLDAFIDLYEKGHVYRGKRMVNWDPKALTAVSDEEVIHREVQGKLYYVNYKVDGTNETVTIATTRPETILGDTAICIHPDDERYKHLHHKNVIVPLVNRKVPIILDEYVEMDFGTGCLKVTPAHDVNDYELGKKHELETIDIFNQDGTLNERAQFFVGEDRFEVRKKIAVKLEDEGYLSKVENYTNKVGFSERTNEVIEPRLSMQWFVAMQDLSKPALDAVLEGEVKFHPGKFVNTYRHWMENVKDWCISRQLWWGHRIPAWYYGSREGEFVVAKTEQEALAKARVKSKNPDIDLVWQDEDVLDTWFSSWLWPISTFDPTAIRSGKENINDELRYYFPTNDLVTAPEIMFFWVARMIIAGYEYLGEKPFKNVYYTGIVRDKQGRKMSKSLGNSPDPIGLIEKHGADGVRVGMLLSSPAGNDLLFDESLCEQGRNFSNKIWNAFRLVRGWKPEEKSQPESAAFAIQWYKNRMKETLIELNEQYDQFRISDALMTTYKLFWDDFCSWYLELVKPPYGENIDKKTYDETIGVFEDMLKMLHPFMPFISEELWHQIKERNVENALVASKWPDYKNEEIDAGILQKFTETARVVSELRTVRKEYQIPNKESIQLFVKGDTSKFEFSVIQKLAGVSNLEILNEEPENMLSVLVGGTQFFIPTGENIDTVAELEKLKKELEYNQGFLKTVQKKLSNDRFVNNAPERVVASERKKESDAQEKIKLIEEKMKVMQA